MVAKVDQNTVVMNPSKLDDIPKEGTVQIKGPEEDEEFEECNDENFSEENEESDIHRMHMMQSL